MAEDKSPCSCGKTKLRMDALQFNTSSKELAINKVEAPKPVGRMVLVKIAYSGICSTDLGIIQGTFPMECEEEPVIMGHEFTGVVAEIGPDVTTVEVGDRVVVDPMSGCGACDYCRSGKPHFCPTEGVSKAHKTGGWAQYCAVADSQVFKLPDCIKYEQACLTQPIACLLHAMDIVGQIEVGKKILIIGSGILGVLTAAIFHRQGQKDVTVSEPIASRLRALDTLGTGYELTNPDTIRDKQRDDPKYAFDYIFECSGSANGVEQAITLLNFGGTLLMLGCYAPCERSSFVPFDIFVKELKIVGALINPYSYPKAVKLVETLGDKYLDYSKLGIKTYDLADYQAAFSELKCGGISKAVFKFDIENGNTAAK